jgi:hypothetical protein
MKTDFSRFCTPAKIYFALAVLSCIVALFHKIKILAVFIKLVFAFIWTFILNWLCSKGYKTIAWVLLVWPYIIMLYIVMNAPKMNMQLQ